MMVVLRRASNSPTDEEYMDVSYYFHDGKSTTILESSQQELIAVTTFILLHSSFPIGTRTFLRSRRYRLCRVLRGTFIALSSLLFPCRILAMSFGVYGVLKRGLARLKVSIKGYMKF